MNKCIVCGNKCALLGFCSAECTEIFNQHVNEREDTSSVTIVENIKNNIFNLKDIDV